MISPSSRDLPTQQARIPRVRRVLSPRSLLSQYLQDGQWILPPAFISDPSVTRESDRRRIGEVLRSFQLRFALAGYSQSYDPKCRAMPSVIKEVFFLKAN